MNRRTVLAGAAGAALSGRALAQPATLGRWRSEAPMPGPAQEIYAAVVPGGYHVVTTGGMAGRGSGPREILDRTAVYDGSRWTLGPRLPSPTHHPAMAGATERVLAFGGYGAAGGGQWRNRAEVISLAVNPRTGVEVEEFWRPVSRMPEPQAECVALAHRGNVHLITGRRPRSESANAEWRDQVDTDAHRVFDVSERRWRTARPAPGARNSAAGAVIDNRLYVVGGRTVGGGNLGDLTRYDPRTDAWETLRPMPQPAGGIAAAALSGRLFVFGGEWFAAGGAGGVYREVWEYDPALDRWRACAPMPTPRHGLAAAVMLNTAVLIGGATRVSAQGTSAVVERFEPPRRSRT